MAKLDVAALPDVLFFPLSGLLCDEMRLPWAWKGSSSDLKPCNQSSDGALFKPLIKLNNFLHERKEIVLLFLDDPFKTAREEARRRLIDTST